MMEAKLFPKSTITKINVSVYESNIFFKCADIDSQEEAIKEEIASIKDKYKSQEREAILNTKNVNLQSRKENLSHYLMTRKVKMKQHRKGKGTSMDPLARSKK